MGLLLAAALTLAAGRDFLLQDVCTDAADRPIPGDPAQCATHRDIRAGEVSPYTHVDRGPNGEHYQSFISFPWGDLIVVAKDFGGDQPGATFGQLDLCNGLCPAFYMDGYDLIEDQGPFVSAIATSDPAQNDQTFWPADCSRNDAWLLFPSDFSPGYAVAHLGRSCGQTSPAYTEWAYLDSFSYAGGQSLPTIVSTHYSGATPDTADAFERFYFTREYGYTRWEAWKRDGATFMQADIRDTTDVLPIPVDPAPFAPRLQQGGALDWWALLTLALAGLCYWPVHDYCPGDAEEDAEDGEPPWAE